MEDFDPKFAKQDRRAFLDTFGKAAIVAPPVITAMLSTSMASPAIAASGGGGPKGNNGVGNGYDPQPPGNPPVNDGPGTGPGNPGNHGHGGGNGDAIVKPEHGQGSIKPLDNVTGHGNGKHG